MASTLEHLGFSEYESRGSPGQGQWVECPWLAILDPLITDSPQRGYYPVYLFREDMSGFYLSLNQGMTEAKEQYQSGAKDALRGRAADFRNRLGKPSSLLPEKEIDLRPLSPGNDSAFYEAGNVWAKFYEASSIPHEDLLLADLAEMMRLYSLLTASADTTTGNIGAEDDEQGNPFIEDYTAFRFHKRIERNPKIAEKVKQLRALPAKVVTLTSRHSIPGSRRTNISKRIISYR
jgi:5-methylcytosine-specific restriction protein A